ncbi:MAG: LUD domain-containing protein [Deltaproteobacteria bacterium]|nr:LUD domain-containing protein [Deltaproteobacteria bacterium]
MEAEKNLRKEISEKLKDETLRDALGRFSEAYPIARAKAYENAGDIEALRDALRQMKIDTVARIEEVADRFEAEATKRGAKVFRAKNGDDLKEYLVDLCRKNGVKKIVKSKSMAAEEIDLNPYLEAAGITATETDLGEWIVALAGQRPSHMVMPAIHLSRFQVAEYFSKELKEEIPPDIAFMVQAARKELREKVLQADMGISGANFGIAENGAIGLVTNEGNARMVTTLPRIHVVIIGYEKLIPTIKDAATILKVLPRSATAQLMTSYLTMIAGPTPAMVKRDGKWVEEKKELHIILLDNGRLRAAHDDKFKEIFQCVRCASCLNVCPVYTLIGGHVYGHIYAGGIGAILTAFFHGMKEFEKFQELCIGCRRCMTVCPGKIDIPGLIEELRIRNVKEKGLPFLLRQTFENIVSNRKLFHSLLRLASVGQKPFQSGKLIRHLPLFLAGLAKDRSLPAIAAEPLRDRIGKITKKIDKPDMRVAFFGGCTIDFVFPETGESVFKVLQDMNMEVLFPAGQSCCGKPVIAMGDVETTKKIARENIKALEEMNPDVIIAACPTCTESLRHYAELLKEDPEWGPKAETTANKIREFCSFVAEEYAKRGRLTKTAGGPKVTYHDSCHLKRVLGIDKEPRQLLEAAGCELVEMKDADKCCGMSGIFGVKYAELSMPILEQKINNIRDTGAEIAVCACSGCMVQLQGGLDKQLPGVRMKHVADILAERIEEK